jgi:hypothetical protein
MTIKEIFKTIQKRQIEGMMFHDEMANYFDFLGMMGFKRLHEYQFFKESAEMRCTSRYYLNHFQKLLDTEEVKASDYIPSNWYRYTRQEVDNSTKRNAIKSGMEKWAEWEKETLSIYEDCYKSVLEGTEIACAEKIEDMLNDVRKELKHAHRLILELSAVDYDLSYILCKQDCLHEHYKKKTKKIGISIC